MQWRKNPDGDPESPWALPNIMEQYGRTHTGEQRVIQEGAGSADMTAQPRDERVAQDPPLEG